MMSRLRHHPIIAAIVAISLCMVAESRPATAGRDDIVWTGPHLSFEASLGIGQAWRHFQSGPSFTELGTATGLVPGLAVHRHWVLRLHLDGLASSVNWDEDSISLLHGFVGPSLQWWAHDRAIVEFGVGQYGSDADPQFVKRQDLDSTGLGFLLSAGYPLAQSGRHHYQLYATVVTGDLDRGDLTYFHSGFRWQWR